MHISVIHAGCLRLFCHITKASGARLEFSLALAVVAVKVLKTTEQDGGGLGGVSTVILSQQNAALEEVGEGGGGVDCDSFTRIEVWRGAGEGVQCDSFCERLRRNSVMFGW